MNEHEPNPEPRRISVQDAIYEFCAVILYFTYTVDDDTGRPYAEREVITKRLCRIMQAILALTVRMNPYKVGELFFAAMRQPPVRKPQAPKAPDEPGFVPVRPGRKPPHLRRLLSARTTARRLAALLRQLDAVIYEYNLKGTEEIAIISGWLRTNAGCDALPDCPPFVPTRPRRRPSPKWPHPTKPGVWLAYEPEDWPRRR